MSDFDARLFPYVFSCRCGAEQEVTRRNCIDHAGHLSRPAEAAEFTVKHLHGWSNVDRVRLQCPKCSGYQERGGRQSGSMSLFEGVG